MLATLVHGWQVFGGHHQRSVQWRGKKQIPIDGTPNLHLWPKHQRMEQFRGLDLQQPSDFKTHSVDGTNTQVVRDLQKNWVGTEFSRHVEQYIYTFVWSDEKPRQWFKIALVFKTFDCVWLCRRRIQSWTTVCLLLLCTTCCVLLCTTWCVPLSTTGCCCSADVCSFLFCCCSMYVVVVVRWHLNGTLTLEWTLWMTLFSVCPITLSRRNGMVPPTHLIPIGCITYGPI